MFLRLGVSFLTYLFIYLYTLFIQKFQFSIAGLYGDLYKIIRINNQIYGNESKKSFNEFMKVRN